MQVGEPPNGGVASAAPAGSGGSGAAMRPAASSASPGVGSATAQARIPSARADTRASRPERARPAARSPARLRAGAYASPSFNSGSIFGFDVPAARSGRTSLRRIVNAVDITKLTASRTIAYGAVSALISVPVRRCPSGARATRRAPAWSGHARARAR